MALIKGCQIAPPIVLIRFLGGMVGVAVALNDEVIAHHLINPSNIRDIYLCNNTDPAPLNVIADTSLAS